MVGQAVFRLHHSLDQVIFIRGVQINIDCIKFIFVKTVDYVAYDHVFNNIGLTRAGIKGHLPFAVELL